MSNAFPSSSNTANNSPTSSTVIGSNGSVTNGLGRKFMPPSLDALSTAAQNVIDPQGDIHDVLRGVRLDELVTLSQSSKAMHTVKEDSSFPASFYIPLYRYLKYIWDTWSNIFRITLTFELPFTDWVGTVLFAAATTVVLGIALIWCQFATNPFIYNLYFNWSNKYAHGLGLVNAADPTLFKALTRDQVDVAKRKLGIQIEESVDTDDLRVFDLDIAKFLLQLASIVYERAPIAIHKTLEQVTAANKASPPRTPKSHISAAYSSARRSTLHRPPNTGTKSPAQPPSPGDTLNASAPGNLVKDIWGENSIIAQNIEMAFKSANEGPGETTIGKFCLDKDIDYEPVSELNNSSSAFCSFFWDNKSNWIVVTFKGTGIAEYADWVTDLTVTLTDVKDFLPEGYNRVIKGFKERLYPSDVSELGGTRPWDSIRYSLCKAAQKLSQMRVQEGKDSRINVWFTGHSLGCALATLAYTRIVSTPSDVAGYPIVIRDCYLFAAPVSADRVTAIKFNETLAAFSASPSSSLATSAPAGHAHARTMWRIRNAGDAVATLLPQLGDRADLATKLSPTNPAAFAHLGAEIIMKDYPHSSEVASPCNHFLGTPSDYARQPAVHVDVRSEFTKGEIKAQRAKRLMEMGEALREILFVGAEQIPLIGRFLAHDTVLYWDQLDRISTSPCKWVSG